jgi:hypothetical protein
MSFFCHDCNCTTESTKPVFFRRLKSNTFYIAAICVKCKREKSRYVNMVLPEIFYDLSYKKVHFNAFLSNGKMVDILEKLKNYILH